MPLHYSVKRTDTIPRDAQSPEPDPQALALGALGWILVDEDRARRLLSLTGLTPDALRDGLTDAATLRAVLDYLAAHEPDLLLAADALGVEPATLVAARERIG